MNNIVIERGYGVLRTQSLLAAIVRLFDKRASTSETPFENRVENRWDLAYRQIERINFEDIFATRLTNLVIAESSVNADDEEIDKLVRMSFEKANKWCPMAFGLGRIFLVPYVIGERIFLDIIPQSREVSLEMFGDEIHGFLAITDIRMVGKQKYARVTHYSYDQAAKTFTVENKAVLYDSGAEVSLTTVNEWETVLPLIVFNGIEKPLFGVVDCPRGSRDSERPQGAPITYGCGDTIAQIHETIRDYQVEYRHKVSVLGIDQTAIDKNNFPGHLPREYVKVNTGGMDSGDLFSVYSPDIRGQAYQDRLLELFGMLEKQVGTSRGILTPAETGGATATEVKRAMKDTLAMVGVMRSTIETAFDSLAYAFQVLLDVIGVRVSGYNLTFDWADASYDAQEEFNVMMQLHSAGVVSDEELRRFKFTSETPEESREAIEKIRADKPDPYGEMLAAEPFGGLSGARDERGGDE